MKCKPIIKIQNMIFFPHNQTFDENFDKLREKIYEVYTLYNLGCHIGFKK